MITRTRSQHWIQPSLAVARHTLALLGAGVLLSLSACHKDTPPPAAETKTEAKPATSKPEIRRPQRTAVDEGVEVPTEEDFEDAVEKQIGPTSNLKKELDQLEKQIQQP